MNVLTLNDITLRRGEKEILKDISWSIELGEHWVLLGANGSGKTSLLKILTGYEWATQGTVRLLGQRFGECDLRMLRRAVGWVSASIENRIPPGDTAAEIVASGFEASLGLYRELKQDEWDLVERCLARVNASQVSARPYRILSQGEQQRVLIARALINQPAVLVLDEPCAGLDPNARRKFLDDLKALAEHGPRPTIIFVTHHVEEIGPWLTHGLILKGGKMLASGTVKQVLTTEIIRESFEFECEVVFEKGEYRLDGRE